MPNFQSGEWSYDLVDSLTNTKQQIDDHQHPNHCHEQLLVGWKQGAMMMETMSRHNNDINSHHPPPSLSHKRGGFLFVLGDNHHHHPLPHSKCERGVLVHSRQQPPPPVKYWSRLGICSGFLRAEQRNRKDLASTYKKLHPSPVMVS